VSGVADVDGRKARAAAHGPIAIDRLKATVLLGNGLYADVLTIFRGIAPERFAEPEGALSPGQAVDATRIGIAQLHKGIQAQGLALLRQARDGMTDHPRMTDLNMDEWTNVQIHVALGEHEQAIAALKQGVADGHSLDLAVLDSDPLLAGLRRTLLGTVVSPIGILKLSFEYPVAGGSIGQRSPPEKPEMDVSFSEGNLRDRPPVSGR
jgi:hypothetical protein